MRNARRGTQLAVTGSVPFADAFEHDLGVTPSSRDVDIIASNPNTIRTIASKSTAVATPSGGYTCTAKPIMIAMMPTIIIPGEPRATPAKTSED